MATKFKHLSNMLREGEAVEIDDNTIAINPDEIVFIGNGIVRFKNGGETKYTPVTKQTEGTPTPAPSR